MKIYVDLDDVLADTVSLLLAIARERFERNVTYEGVRSFDLAKSLDLQPEEHDSFMKCFHEREILLRIPPMPGAKEAVTEWLARGDEVIVATGRPNDSADTCLHWLSENGFMGTKLLLVDKYPHSHKKGSERPVALARIPAMGFDVVIEDSPEVATYLSHKMPRRILLVRRPWNEHLSRGDVGSSMFLVNDWEQICRTIEELRR